MFNGTIYVTYHENAFINCVNNGWSGVIISGNIPESHPLVRTTNSVIGSILLPPPMASMAEVDGNMDAYITMYTDHLMQKNQNDFIAALLTGVYKGKNIIIFTTPEEYRMSFIRVLSQYFFDVFGVIIGGVNNNEFSIMPNLISNILGVIYMSDMISAQEYLLGQPQYLSNPFISQKLFDEQRPYICKNPNIQDINDYYNNILHNKLYGLINPIQFEK